jgi:hypothetical protein
MKSQSRAHLIKCRIDKLRVSAVIDNNEEFLQSSFDYVDFWGTVSDLLKREDGDQLPDQDDQQVRSPPIFPTG